MFQVKCEKYWPDVGAASVEYANIAVRTVKIEEWSDHVVRTLSVTKVCFNNFFIRLKIVSLLVHNLFGFGSKGFLPNLGLVKLYLHKQIKHF